MGVTAVDIKSSIRQFHIGHPKISPLETLALSEYILERAQFSEEVLVAFGLINKFVNKNYDESLLIRLKFWLENYASNWSHVDDLCMKTIYQFLMARPHLIEQIKEWAHSDNAWCRRASNVVWVKFVHRKIGRSTYILDKELILNQCEFLLSDPDEYVQKSIGWLLKVSWSQHPNEIVSFIENNITRMQRATLRYAIEKMPQQLRQELLSLTRSEVSKD